MNEREAQLTIMRQRYSKGFVLPNYTPSDWWECDVFERTAAGYFREYEIKLSVADFKVDKHKECFRYWRDGKHLNPPESRKKHELLAVGDLDGPRQFFYVTPVGLLQPEMIPAWAGWIELEDKRPGHAAPWRYDEILKKKAPFLHRQKMSDKTIQAAKSVTYYRLMNLLIYGNMQELKQLPCPVCFGKALDSSLEKA